MNARCEIMNKTIAKHGLKFQNLRQCYLWHIPLFVNAALLYIGKMQITVPFSVLSSREEFKHHSDINVVTSAKWSLPSIDNNNIVLRFHLFTQIHGINWIKQLRIEDLRYIVGIYRCNPSCTVSSGKKCICGSVIPNLKVDVLNIPLNVVKTTCGYRSYVEVKLYLSPDILNSFIEIIDLGLLPGIKVSFRGGYAIITDDDGIIRKPLDFEDHKRYVANYVSTDPQYFIISGDQISELMRGVKYFDQYFEDLPNVTDAPSRLARARNFMVSAKEALYDLDPAYAITQCRNALELLTMKMDENVKVLRSDIKEWMLGNCKGYKRKLMGDVFENVIEEHIRDIYRELSKYVHGDARPTIQNAVDLCKKVSVLINYLIKHKDLCNIYF